MYQPIQVENGLGEGKYVDAIEIDLQEDDDQGKIYSKGLRNIYTMHFLDQFIDI